MVSNMRGRGGGGERGEVAGRLSLKLGAAMMAACYVVLFLTACCGVEGTASGEAHPHQGKVKVGGNKRLGAGMGVFCRLHAWYLELGVGILHLAVTTTGGT